ncbi:MAG: PQQ-binding-like beta-propeller repeat protein [Halieaceae bacterium]
MLKRLFMPALVDPLRSVGSLMRSFLFLCLSLCLGLSGAAAAADGEALYAKHCQHCHGGKVSKAPPISLLQIMSASSIYRAISEGVMREQASELKQAERVALAEYLTGQKLVQGKSAPPAPACSVDDDWFNFEARPDQAGWGMDLRNQRRVAPEVAGIGAKDLSRAELKWALAFPDAIRARSQPATAGGALFVGSQNGTVYALDQNTGCIRWTFETVAEVRTAIIVQDWSQTKPPHRPLLFFGDLVGNVYAVDALSGKLAWRDRPDDHPSLTLTAAPALHDGVLYVPLSSLEVTAAADPSYACCTFRGGVAAYDALSGKLLWTGYTIDKKPTIVGKNSVGTPRIAPSGSPVWNTPSLDIKRGVMYVGTGENYSSPANDTSDAIIALSLDDGHIVWKQQMTPGDAWNMGCETELKINCPPENGPDYDFGAATIIARTSAGDELVIAGQKSGDVYALDPDNGGAVVWHRKLGRGGIQGGVHFGMAVDGDLLYVPMSDFDGGPRWPGTPHPGMFALDLATGKTRWFTPAVDVCQGREFCQPGISAPATAIEGGVVAGAMDGHLRAYDRLTGKVIWDVDTTLPVPTLDGKTSRGGSIGGSSGPVFKDGMLFINSGYGIYFHMPGNVLQAYGLSE